MRFLYLSDSHCRGDSPPNRIDDFVNSLQLKLDEVALLARELEVTALLHGGDLWDYPNPSFAVAESFISRLKAAGAPLYIIAGNHDLQGQDLSTLPYTMLGLQGALGAVRIINSRDCLYFQNEHIRVQVTGQPYHKDIDHRDPRLDYCIKKQNCDYAIHLVHGMLMAGDDFPGSTHTHFTQVYETEADLTLAGHMHFGFPDHEYQGKWFLNIGALVRLTNHLMEFYRPPQVLLIDLSQGQVKLRKIPLKSVLPGHRVLDQRKAELTDSRIKKLAESVRGARRAGEFPDYSLKELVDFFGTQEGLSRGIRMEVLRCVYTEIRLAEGACSNEEI